MNLRGLGPISRVMRTCLAAVVVGALLPATASAADPVAVADSVTVDEDHRAVLDVLSNDIVDPGPAPEIESVTSPAHGDIEIGTLEGSPREVVFYWPDEDYCNTGAAPDQLTYTLEGGSTATVAVTVNCVNDGPIFEGFFVSVFRNSTNNVLSPFASAFDIEGDPFTIALHQPSHGTVTIVPDGSNRVQYTPDPGYCGPDSFRFWADGWSWEDEYASINVYCEDTPPWLVRPSTPTVRPPRIPRPAVPRPVVDSIAPILGAVRAISRSRKLRDLFIETNEAGTATLTYRRKSGKGYKTFATQARSLVAGKNTIRARKLKKGVYRLRVEFWDKAGNPSKSKTLTFRTT